MLLLLFCFCLIVVGAIYWPVLIGFRMSRKDLMWYNNTVWYQTSHGCPRRRRVMLAPPSWIFPIVWFILYGLIAAAMILYGLTITDYLIPPIDLATLEIPLYHMIIFSLFFVNISFNHWWSIVFFGQRRIGMAAALAFIIAGTAIAIVVMLGIVAQWLPFGLFIPYPIWTVFAFILNVNWLMVSSPAKVVAHPTPPQTSVQYMTQTTVKF